MAESLETCARKYVRKYVSVAVDCWLGAWAEESPSLCWACLAHVRTYLACVFVARLTCPTCLVYVLSCWLRA